MNYNFIKYFSIGCYFFFYCRFKRYKTCAINFFKKIFIRSSKISSIKYTCDKCEYTPNKLLLALMDKYTQKC